MPYIAHIAYDDKFVDMGFREFEAVAPGQNRLVIRGKPRPLRFIKSSAVQFNSLGRIKKLFCDEQCAAIVFHSLHDYALLKHAPASKPIVWLGWGYDYYGNLLSGAYPNGLLLPETKALLNGRPTVPPSLLATCDRFRRRVLGVARRLLGRSARYDPRLIAKVDVFSPVIDLEYKMARELNPWFKSKYVPWNYGTLEDDLIDRPAIEDPGPNILIGNNAAFENNHADTFSLVERHVNLSGRKIFVPLSYGGDDWYKETIIKLGKKKFGDQFVPLTDFMPKSEYIALLQSCGHAFMNHLRQQAVGNICMMMLGGARIYMNPRSPLYSWLEARGCLIDSISSIKDGLNAQKIDLLPLSKRDQQNNIEVIRAHWGRDIQRKKTRRLFDIIMNDAQINSDD